MSVILIVEDNVQMRRMLNKVVSGFASAVYECTDGSEAMAAYQQYHPDFVLMDIAMKDIDGITATRQLKAVDAAARVIIVTNYDEDDMREAAQEAGACGYVLKDNLLEVRHVLQHLSA